MLRAGTPGLCHQLSQRSAFPTRPEPAHPFPRTPPLCKAAYDHYARCSDRQPGGHAGARPMATCSRTWSRAGCFQLGQTGSSDGLDEGERKGRRRVTASCVSPGASAGAIYNLARLDEQPVCGTEAGWHPPWPHTQARGGGHSGAGHVPPFWFLFKGAVCVPTALARASADAVRCVR